MATTNRDEEEKRGGGAEGRDDVEPQKPHLN